jgi:uncharacterized protein YndB with AHSA1/START domain
MRTTVDVSVEVEIERPPAAVWSFVSDVERLPDWLGDFATARLETSGPVRRGTVVGFTLKQGGRSGSVEIVEWDPPRRWVWDGPPLRWAGGAARPRGSFELFEAGAGRTLVVGRFRPELTGTQVLLRPYLSRWLRRQRRADAQALKRLLEGDTP